MTDAPSPALQLDALTKRFGAVQAVDGVDLGVRQGELVTLLGPSGSGKTTILRMIAGFEQPTSGSILLEGRDISHDDPAEREIGVVFQHYALFPHLSVADNVAYSLKLRRWPKAEARDRVAEVLRLVRLDQLADRAPKALSGGQQQRVALARALAFRPSLLLMDEPLGALDRALRREMEQEIRRIHRESGATIVYVTHDQEEALTLSDRVGVMRDGRLVQLGPPEELYELPSERFVATFFGDCTLIPARADRPDGDDAQVVIAEVLGAKVSIRAAGRGLADGHVAVRPSRFSLVPRDGDVRLPVAVVDALYLGETSRVVCHHESIGEVIVRAAPRAVSAYRRGDRLELGFSPDDAVFVPAG